MYVILCKGGTAVIGGPYHGPAPAYGPYGPAPLPAPAPAYGPYAPGLYPSLHLFKHFFVFNVRQLFMRCFSFQYSWIFQLVGSNPYFFCRSINNAHFEL